MLAAPRLAPERTRFGNAILPTFDVAVELSDQKGSKISLDWALGRSSSLN
jgi:hypothetical protein